MGVGRWKAVTAIPFLLLVIGGLPGIADGLLNEGLYISNKSDILFIRNPEIPDDKPVSVYKQTGSIIGLTYDKCTDQLFWSNIDIVNRGIYRGSLDADGKVDNVTKIIDTDVLEVNGLTYDWVSKHLYWTDGRKKTIEISDSDGGNRRILIMTERGNPRGIHADPISGYLFWTDQGQKHIARSNLDGSDRKVIVSQRVNQPNQITVYNRTLYWVDSFSKTFESSDLNGGNRLTESITTVDNDQDIFGLAIHDRRAYVTKWVNGQVIGVDTNGRNVAMGTRNLGKERLFSAIYVKSSYQPKGDDPCASKGCAALCLPIGQNLARCSCPSYGGRILSTDGRACITPSNTNSLLFVAMADSGYVGFFDASNATKRDFYAVGRSLRPVAVAYDPVTKNVFWSDVRERSVHLVNIDGRNHQILLRNIHGVGLVEGMLVDVARRQLYYTNIGSVFINATPYSWHRIETFSLRSLTNVKVKTIVTTADKPRGLALDTTNGHLYYTDWGNRASIVRVNLDGSNPTLIKTGLDNPNGIVFHDNMIYFVDSHFKSREATNENGVIHGSKNGSVYSMNLDGSNFRNILATSQVKLRTPFGLTSTSSGLYVGDWETENLILLSTDGTLSETVLQETSGLMSLAYTPFTANAGYDLCASKRCGDICLSKSTSEASCTCNSYGGKSIVNTGDSCAVPSQFLIVADMNSIKMVSQDGKDLNAYVAVQGKQPFVSNYVGLAFDDVNQVVYYSDISGRSINALHLSNMSSNLYFRINEVIDGMVHHDGYLYWTDYTNGRICRLKIRLGQGDELRRETIAFNLSRPRGIRIHDNYLYWTEWGGTPKIQRMTLNSKQTFNERKTERMYASSLKLVWPNGLSIYNNKLYIVDGSTKKIYRCELNPRDTCQTIDGTEETLKHAYDLWATEGGVFYYSDWETGSIKAFDSSKPGKTWTIVEGLMRPTQFHFVPLSSVSARPTCPSGTCSGGSCIPLRVNHGCDCGDRLATDDLKNCTSELAASCSHGGNSYAPDKTYNPSVCLNCRCLGRRSWANHPIYNDSVCERISCPKLDCGGGKNQSLPNQCCRSCKTCGIRITNCPKTTVNLNLPHNRGYVVYDFLPTIKDCFGLAREVSTTRKPHGAIYKRGTTDVTVSSTANGDDHADCSFQVIVKDVTAPKITCPENIQTYLTSEDTSVEVKWKPPEVTENDELGDGQPKSSRSWGSSFNEGVHNITYTAKDKSEHSSSCSFQVTVERLEKTAQGNCKIPQIDNAVLECSVSSLLRCSFVKCQNQYTLVNKGWKSSCSDRGWLEPVTDAVHKACIKTVFASVIGSLSVKVPESEGVCSEAVDLKYIREFLKDTINKNHFGPYVKNPKLEVTAKGCNPPSKELEIEISVVGQSSKSEQKNLTDEINNILSNIREELNGEFIRIPIITGPTGVRTAHEMSITMTNATVGCLSGQIPKEDKNCVVCDVGTYHEKSNNTCVRCPPDTYNSLEGQTECTKCPGGAKSGTGSYILDQCIFVSRDIPLLIPLSIGFGLLLLLLFIIVIVCVKRRSDSKILNDNSKVTVNKVYDPDLDFDCTYDKIADPLPEEPLTNKNNYESLEAAAAGTAEANTYDKIAFNVEGNEKCEEARGGYNAENEDGNSTPPYLEPVKV